MLSIYCIMFFLHRKPLTVPKMRFDLKIDDFQKKIFIAVFDFPADFDIIIWFNYMGVKKCFIL